MIEKKIEAGFSQKVISPEKGISLVGYFNNRYNQGIHDHLYAKAMVLSDQNSTAAFIVFDNALIPRPVVETIRKKIAPETGIPEKNISLQATHTHTAPAICEGSRSWVDFSPAYLEYFIKQAVASVLEAKTAMQPVTFSIAEGKEEKVAFNRRFLMKDGKVVTNPAKDSPNILRPEGEIDHYLAVVAVKNLSGKIIAVLVHCANHVDTIGGDLVSADWPGVLCNYLTEKIEGRPPVIFLGGMAGNINHVNINNLQQANGFAEAERVGTTYGQTALSLFKTGLQSLVVSRISVNNVMVSLPRVQLTEVQIKEAKTIVEKTPIPNIIPFLHSDDLAKNNEIIQALFARKQLDFVNENKTSELVEISGLRIGDLFMVGFPMETFSEIGTELKRKSPFKYTFPLGLVNGAFGYLGTKEAAEHVGGMETFPGLSCLRNFVPEAASMLIKAAKQLMLDSA